MTSLIDIIKKYSQKILKKIKKHNIENMLIIGSFGVGKSCFYNNVINNYAYSDVKTQEYIYCTLLLRITQIGKFGKQYEKFFGTENMVDIQDDFDKLNHYYSKYNMDWKNLDTHDDEIKFRLENILNNESFISFINNYSDFGLTDGLITFLQKNFSDGFVTFDNFHKLSDSQKQLYLIRKTIGFNYTNLRYANSQFKLSDCGGHKSERKKIDYKDHPNCVYVCSLTDFTKTCYESGKGNRLIDNVEYFQELINNKTFKGKNLTIIFSKKDILHKILRNKNICKKIYNLRFDQSLNYENVIEFHKDMFLNIMYNCGYIIKYNFYISNFLDIHDTKTIVNKMFHNIENNKYFLSNVLRKKHDVSFHNYTYYDIKINFI